MDVALLAFIAGVLTVLSPCILPLLPVVLSGALSTKDRLAPYVIISSSAVSIILFTLLLKGTSFFLGIPSSVWFIISGVLIAFIGVTLIFPVVWKKLMQLLKIQEKTGKITESSRYASGQKKNILLGLSLGPVFTSCSPTYGLIIATVLPVDFLRGTAYILLYALGLSLVLLVITFGGTKVASRLQWFTKPAFTRTLGVILLITGLLIATGLIKEIEILLIESGYDLTRFEWNFLNRSDSLFN
jgi:cytochrome c biogenesis protein CcdA